MTPIVELPDIRNLVLAYGPHRSRAAGMCLLEAVAFFAGERHSDSPVCVDVALAAFGRSFNDRLRDDERQQLRDLVPRLVDTAGSRALSQRRSYLLVDRYVRWILPAFFRELPHKPRPDVAEKLEALAPIVDAETAAKARKMSYAVRDELRRDRDAAWAALTPKQRSAYAADAAYAAVAAAYAADAAAYAADAAYAAYAADAAAAAAAAAALKDLRARTIQRSIASFVEAIELTESV